METSKLAVRPVAGDLLEGNAIKTLDKRSRHTPYRCNKGIFWIFSFEGDYSISMSECEMIMEKAMLREAGKPTESWKRRKRSLEYGRTP